MLNGSAIWTFLRRGWCQHPDMVRLHTGGVWYFWCPCGYHTPIMRRDPGDRPPPKAT